MSSKRNVDRFLLVFLFLVWAVSPARSQDTEQPARLRVLLPADAKLIIEDVPTKQTGSSRRFKTPPLMPGKSYHYTLKWSYEKEGKTVTQTKVVHVRAGDDIEVDLREPEKAKNGAVDKKTLPDRTPVPPKGTQKQPLPGKNAAPQAKREPDVPFVATPLNVVEKMLELAAVTKEDVVYDLGCGDGIIVVTAAKKYKCKAVGFDIDPDRVKESRESVKKSGVEKLVTIEEKDIFDVDLTPASVVTLYLLSEVNLKLLPQLQKLKPGSRIVSHDFPIQGLKPKKEETVRDKDNVPHKVYLWVTPLEKKK